MSDVTSRDVRRARVEIDDVDDLFRAWLAEPGRDPERDSPPEGLLDACWRRRHAWLWRGPDRVWLTYTGWSDRVESLSPWAAEFLRFLASEGGAVPLVRFLGAGGIADGAADQINATGGSGARSLSVVTFGFVAGERAFVLREPEVWLDGEPVRVGVESWDRSAGPFSSLEDEIHAAAFARSRAVFDERFDERRGA